MINILLHRALYDSKNKAKTSVFAKKSSGLTKEWRQNNRELLDSGSQVQQKKTNVVFIIQKTIREEKIKLYS